LKNGKAGKYMMNLKTLPGDARLAYRHEGVRGAWKAVATRFLHRLIRTGRVIVFAQSIGDADHIAPPPGVMIRVAGLSDRPAFASLAGEREGTRFDQLLRNGRHCLIAWRGEKPVGYAWVADQAGPDVTFWPLPFGLPANAAYLWNLYVLPTERSSGIGSALAQARLRLARERGFEEGWRMVAPFNTASLRTVRKSAAGTRIVGEVRFVQLLDRAYARFTPST
jgi:ribosomal protein S18 acetylase RimI-like enzyme